MRLDALTFAPWAKNDSSENIIVGLWAEDYSKYRIVVPAQLRDLIIHMQNQLCEEANSSKKHEMKNCYGQFHNDRTCDLCLILQENYARACKKKKEG